MTLMIVPKEALNIKAFGFSLRICPPYRMMRFGSPLPILEALRRDSLVEIGYYVMN